MSIGLFGWLSPRHFCLEFEHHNELASEFTPSPSLKKITTTLNPDSLFNEDYTWVTAIFRDSWLLINTGFPPLPVKFKELKQMFYNVLYHSGTHLCCHLASYPVFSPGSMIYFPIGSFPSPSLLPPLKSLLWIYCYSPSQARRDFVARANPPDS